MEHGIITNVRYNEGVALCDVQAIRVATEYKDVPMTKPFAGFTVMPSPGQKVGMAELSDGTRFITQVIAKEDEFPASMSPGELAIQLDASTKVTITESGDSYTLTLHGDDVDIEAVGSAVSITAAQDVNVNASGDANIVASGNANVSGASVFINGIDFESHVHDFEDSTIADTSDGTGTESTATKQTAAAKQPQ